MPISPPKQYPSITYSFPSINKIVQEFAINLMAVLKGVFYAILESYCIALADQQPPLQLIYFRSSVRWLAGLLVGWDRTRGVVSLTNCVARHFINQLPSPSLVRDSIYDCTECSLKFLSPPAWSPACSWSNKKLQNTTQCAQWMCR